jgi:hypothetical protein
LRLIILILFKGSSCVLSSRKKVNSLVEGERPRLYLIMLILFKGPNYILGDRERVNNFIKGGRLR